MVLQCRSESTQKLGNTANCGNVIADTTAQPTSRMNLLQSNRTWSLLTNLIFILLGLTGIEAKWTLDVDVIHHLELLSGISETCRTEARVLQHHLVRLDTWAVKMYDASAKPGSGMLNGNINQFGDYDQCVSVREDHPRIAGQYCLALIYVELRDPRGDSKLATILDLVQSYQALPSSYSDGNTPLPTFSTVSWGVCVPSGCSPADVESALAAALRSHNLTLDIHVVVDRDSCEVHRPMDIFQGGTFITLLIILSIFFIAVSGTFYEISEIDKSSISQEKNYSFIPKIMLAFSFRKNIMELMDIRTQKDEILCLHGIRFVFSMIIYLLHRAIFNLYWPATNRTNMAELLESAWTMSFRAVWNNLDTFVVLSGLLTSYHMTKHLQSGRTLNIPAMYLYRYIKFTPILMLAVFLIKNTIEEFRRGPQVMRIIRQHVHACQNIWKPLFYLSNIDGVDKMCFPPSHHLLSDFYLYLGSPFLTLLLWRYRLRGALYIALFLACLTLYKAVVIHSGQLATYIYYSIPPSKICMSANQLYLNPLFRSVPYVVGTLLGFYLRISATKTALLSRYQVAGGWLLAAGAACYSFLGPGSAYLRSYRYDVVNSMVYGSLQPFTWSLALSWVIYLCHTRQADFLNNILSWRGFVVFSRISYAFYIVQFIVMFWNISSAQVPQYVYISQIIDLNEIFCILLFSTLSTLLFLLPFKGLYEMFTKKEIILKIKKER